MPLLLRVNSSIVGFALLNRHDHTDRPLDRNMAEFFVLRKHRRSGAGTAAAQAIFTPLSGHVGGRDRAQEYRRPVVLAQGDRRASAGAGIEEIDLATPAWNGPVLRFRIGE